METKEKDLITKYTALAVITMVILITWSFMKKDYVEFTECIIAVFTAAIMLGVCFFNEKVNTSIGDLCISKLTEVIPLNGEADSKYFAKLDLDGFGDCKPIVKIYKDNKFFCLVNKEDFPRFFEIKEK